MHLHLRESIEDKELFIKFLAVVLGVQLVVGDFNAKVDKLLLPSGWASAGHGRAPVFGADCDGAVYDARRLRCQRVVHHSTWSGRLSDHWFWVETFWRLEC